MSYSELKRSFIRRYKMALKTHPNENTLKIAFVLFDEAEFYRKENYRLAFDTLNQAWKLVYFFATDGMIDEYFRKAIARSVV